MCFYTVTKLKLKTLTVAKLSGQRWVWQRRCFGLEIIIHHCRMSCCSQKHQHRHCRQKRCKRKKENNVENILNIKYIDDLFLLYAFFSFPNKFLPLLLSFIHKKKYLGQALWKFYFKRFFFFFSCFMALSQNKLETYVSPGTSVFVWPCCPLVMWCVQLLLPAQVWPTGLRWAYLSRFAQPIKTLKAFFLLKNEKYFLLILDLNQVIYFIGMQRQSLWGRHEIPRGKCFWRTLAGWLSISFTVQ